MSDQEAKGNEHSMWINAFTLVSPTDETCLSLGKEIIELVRRSMSRERDALEPIGLVTIRIAAS